jgi:hypothetical protein
MIKGRKSLAETHPEVAKEWHPSLNGDLTASEVTPGSKTKVWWKCDKGEDHEWKSTIAHRSNGRDCPICSGNKVVLSNCLATTNPDLAEQWHLSKNGNLTPFDITEHSGKKAWWKCVKGDDHEWESAIYNRSNGRDCPICSNKKTVLSNCLATTNPDLAEQWHPSKNGDLTPFDITEYSGKKVWWKCDKGEDHEWKASLNSRSNGGCTICSGRKTVLSNCLATTNPDLAEQWHPILNGDLTSLEITQGSPKKVWWKCDKGEDHEWKASLNSRSNGNNCPVCAGQKTVLSNCLATTNPDLAEQWHPILNGDLTAYNVTSGSSRKNIWWKCHKGEDHEWRTSVDNRLSKGSNCPFCTLTPQSKQELTITFELKKLFNRIDPKGLKAKLGGRLRAIDIYVPKLNLCIEFDGSYWHKDKIDIDKIKSEMLFQEGFKLIRVREEPLKKIYDSDIISKQPYNGKQVTNDLLSRIMELYTLPEKLVSKIKDYQAKEELQNERGLDRYIDKILTEKAEKNTNE